MANHFLDAVPDSRVRTLVDRSPSPQASYVLYWMIAARRTRHSFALQRARGWAAALGKPLLVFEPLRAGYRWAADRHHVFVMQGMQDQATRLAKAGVRYLPYVEPRPGAGQGLLATLAEQAAVVVTDDFPAFFLPRMLEAAARQVPCRMEAVDGNGLLPIRATDRVFTRAHSLRAYLQKELAPHLEYVPVVDPLARYDLGKARVPRAVLQRWPMATAAQLRSPAALAATLPLDHAPGPVAGCPGGSQAGTRRLGDFVADTLARYGDDRNHPDESGSSGLSPYLHYGHVGAHQVLHAIARHEDWTPAALGPPQGGSRSGWWGMSEAADSFLDELVTWRELGLNFCTYRDDYDSFESLPKWALTTMAEHETDPRPHLYDLQQLERAQTHDPLWNAAQRQMLEEGRIHNYLRMLWGKKIYQWSPNGREAMRRMIELNNRWCLDGRDPNSYSGIAWVLGRYDRAWGPERPVFGKLRYMTSQSTQRKLRVGAYLARYSEQLGLGIDTGAGSRGVTA